MAYVIMNLVTESLFRPTYCEKHYDTLRGAKNMATRLNKHTVSGKKEWVAISYSEFDRLFNPIVTVFNCLTGKPVQIRKSDKGGPCDPSTERYHSM